MYELEKIEEAKYFYSQMSKEKDNRDNLKYSLSAFLSSARSVLQYAFREAETNNGGQYWYDSQVSGNKVVSFFKDKRDINIHAEPVFVRKDVDVKLSETIHLSESISIIIRDSAGNIKGGYSSEPKTPKQWVGEPPVVETRYRFDDWADREDIFTLCQKYLKELEAIITDGKSKGFLSQ